MIKKYSRENLDKYAGEKEKKRAKGINFEHIKKLLSQSGEEVPRSAIDEAQKEDSNLAINAEKLNWIEALNLNDQVRRERLSEHETYLLIVGAAISSSSLEESREKIATLNNYLITNHEIRPGSFNLNLSDLYDIDKIKELFNINFTIAEEWERTSKEKEKESRKDEYRSNEVVYNFSDGWRVVYVPAVGEMNPYPGIPNSSHDRILEGNKNGLCLGESMKLYQNNDNGKIYSVRDQSNKPRVTCRIKEDNLLEAKGKNNLTPDVEAGIHAIEWFETINNLKYKQCDDYKNFPPTKKEEALDKFLEDKDGPYKNKWITSWYNKGILAIDDDVERRIILDDPKIFQSGLGKKYKELVEPVIRHWCEKYVSDENVPHHIIFGSRLSPPEHEVFKTYRKSPWMFKAVERLSVESPILYFEIGLFQIKEYDALSDGPIRNQASNDPYPILSKFSDSEWAKPHIKTAAESLFNFRPLLFLSDELIDKDFSKDYIVTVAKKYSERDTRQFLQIYRFNEKIKNHPEIKPYIISALQKFSEEDPVDFLDIFGDDKNATPFLKTVLKNLILAFNNQWLQREVRLTIKSLFKKHQKYITSDLMTTDLINSLEPTRFIDHLRDVEVFQEYIPIFMENFANKDPEGFIGKYGEEEFVIESGLLEKAIEDFADRDPCNFLVTMSKHPMSQRHLQKTELDCVHRDPVEFIYSFGGEKYDDIIKDILPREYDHINNFIYSFIINKNHNYLNYLEFVFKTAADYYPDIMLHYYNELRKNSDFKKYFEIAVKKIIDTNPQYLIDNHFYDDWADKYIEDAVVSFAKNDPYTFLNEYSDYDWSQPYIEIANNQILNNSDESSSQTKNSHNLNKKLLKLANTLSLLGIKKEAKSVLILKN